MTARPVALVTGGTRGIGRAICDALAPTHRVLVGGRDALAAQAVAAVLPDASTFVADLLDADATAAAATALDRLDVLVHSAGVVSVGNVADLPRAEWTRLLETNVTAVADLSRLLLPALRASHGQIITINSGSGFRSGPGGSAYAASKFALRALTDALREEERGRVRVTSIHPGRVATDMQEQLWATAGTPYDPRDHLTPESVAACVRLAVDLPPEANVDELSIRPAVQRNP